MALQFERRHLTFLTWYHKRQSGNGGTAAPDSFDDWDNWDWSFWDYGYGGGGGDYSYLPDLPSQTINYPVMLPEPGISAGSPFELISNYLRDFLSGFVTTINSDGSYQNQPNSPDWISGYPNNQPQPGIPNIADNWPGTPDSPALPGYCQKGSYHPINDPFACVPFPNDDATKRKQATVQRQGAQQQARQKRVQQQAANKTCPKNTWRNPKTNNCEPIPKCAPGTKFDQVSAQCLKSSDLRNLYGQQGSWLWWIVGGVVFFVLISRKNDSPKLRRKR